MHSKRTATKEEREYMAKVATMPCCISGKRPVSVHHCDTGMGRKKDNYKTIPLHYDYHQGKYGIHTLSRRGWEKKFGVTELELVKQTQEMLGYRNE